VKLKTIAAIAFVAVFFTRTAHAEGEATPVKIIYETDMESDVDDAATLAMLHILADAGECEILAVMHNTSDDYGVGVIDAINTYYGRGDLPIGAYKSDDAPSSQFGGAMHYAKSKRRGQDSNLRTSFPVTDLANPRFRPLSHLSMEFRARETPAAMCKNLAMATAISWVGLRGQIPS
jgi:hypothetical protein